MIKNFWNTLSGSARTGFVSGLLVILLMTIWCAVWLLKTDYQVLFSDLKPQDTAAMVAELDRLKIPYKVAESGNAILVDKEIVPITRLKLMGKDIPLNGAVGFELFNNSDFGMTEFAQKINFQRALQGEITRTISALDEVKDVRVHLAFPEEGLFKHANSKTKAAITIGLKPGKRLLQEQINGIQKLVAAAVPGILIQDVTIVDRQGIALTHSVNNLGEGEATTGNLDLKKDTENLLSHKVNDVLEQSFGVGQAIASVDVVLNMDQIRVTTENVISPPALNGQTPTGVIVREKETLKDPPSETTASGLVANRGGSSQRETEYQLGRKVEQVIGQPGTIQRINVVAVVRKPLSDSELENVKALVSAAVGVVAARGDTVVVQSLNTYSGVQKNSVETGLNTEPANINLKPEVTRQEQLKGNGLIIIALLLILMFVIIVAFYSLKILYKKRNSLPSLSDEQRELALAQIQNWMHGKKANHAAGEKNEHSVGLAQ